MACADTNWDADELMKLKVEQLKNLLRNHGQLVSGKKSELVSRSMGVVNLLNNTKPHINENPRMKSQPFNYQIQHR